jgi:hypothetical protein
LPSEMVGGAVVLGHRQVRRKLVQIRHNGPLLNEAGRCESQLVCRILRRVGLARRGPAVIARFEAAAGGAALRPKVRSRPVGRIRRQEVRRVALSS